MLTKREEPVVTGLLLSDLSIERTRKYARAAFDVQHKEFGESIMRHLEYFSWSPIKLSRDTWRARTRDSPTFLDLHREWYRGEVKIVPKTVRLTPEACYWWYLGDGSVGDYYLKLSTYAFTVAEVTFLREQLLDLFSIDTTVRETNVIFIKSKSVLDFLDLIGPSRVRCYDYKWKARVKKRNGEWVIER